MLYRDRMFSPYGGELESFFDGGLRKSILRFLLGKILFQRFFLSIFGSHDLRTHVWSGLTITV
jgi:hypothetical protein